MPIRIDVSGTTDLEEDPISFRFFPEQLFVVDPENPAIATIVFEAPGTKIIHVFADDPIDRDVLRLELEVLDEAFSWHNRDNPADVDNDGTVAPLDALLAINELQQRRFSDAESGEFELLRPEMAGFLDTDNNQLLTPLDALRVINALNESQSNAMSVQQRQQYSANNSTEEERPREIDLLTQIFSEKVAENAN